MFALDKPVVWVIILLIIIVLFGANRLTDIGKSLGKGIREFKEETQGPKEETTETLNTASLSANSAIASDEEVVITKRERKHEDGTVEVVEERVIRKKAQT